MRARFLVSLFLISSIAKANFGIGFDCRQSAEIVPLAICIDDEVRELDSLRERIQLRIFSRIEFKYAKKDPDRAKLLKEKVGGSIALWERYRISYCDMESIHMENNDNRNEFIKQCLVSITKNRIEDLRLLQINI